MKSGLRVLFGVALALLFSIIVIGSITLAILETGELAVVQAPTKTSTYIEHAFPTFINIVPGQPSSTPLPSDTPVLLKSPTPTSTSQCLLPDGWIEIVLQPGDTLDNVAARYGIDPATLAIMNCMSTDTMIVGAIFYVPSPGLYDTPTPTASFTPTVYVPQCGPPSSWVQYRIRRGDTLTYLSDVLGVSISWLQFANCMGGSTTLYAGDLFWVPFYPPLPTHTPTWIWLPTFTPTWTSVVFPTVTNTPIPSAPPPPTNTATPTDTQVPTQTSTFTPQYSPTATHTSPPPTNTTVPSATPTPTKKPTQTMIPTYTSTAIPTYPFP